MGKTIKIEPTPKTNVSGDVPCTSAAVSKSKCETFHTYKKRDILRTLKSINCNPNKSGELLKQFKNNKVSFETIKKFVETESSRCQNLVRNNFMHQEFEEASNLIDQLDAKNCKATCTYDVSLVLQAIASTEAHPAPESIGGIDLKQLYGTLANLSMGYPTEELNQESRAFLHECYADLRLELQSDKAMEEINCMDKDMHDKLHPEPQTYFESNLNSSELNPMQVPLTYLIPK